MLYYYFCFVLPDLCSDKKIVEFNSEEMILYILKISLTNCKLIILIITGKQ